MTEWIEFITIVQMPLAGGWMADRAHLSMDGYTTPKRRQRSIDQVENDKNGYNTAILTIYVLTLFIVKCELKKMCMYVWNDVVKYIL